MAAKKNRIKAPAMPDAPQTRDECAAWIKDMGEYQRNLTRVEANMNDEIAAATARYQQSIDEYKAMIQAKLDGIKVWCEAHRDQLTEGGKVKTANLVNGSVQWRQRPPSVSIRGVESVLDTLERLGLGRFVRLKREPNKEAMLNEPDAVRGVAGITIVTGVEDFVVTPFEQEAA
jgi:phage host-nuclease inhibitor protein Gam